MTGRGRSARTKGRNDRLLKSQDRQAHGTASLSDRHAAPTEQAVREFISACLCPFCGKGPYKVLPLHTWRIHAVDGRTLRKMAGLRVRDAVSSDEFCQKHRDKVENDPAYKERFVEAGRASMKGPRNYLNDAQTARGLPRSTFDPADPADPRHGTVNGYVNLKCRCDRCLTVGRARARANNERAASRRSRTSEPQ